MTVTIFRPGWRVLTVGQPGVRITQPGGGAAIPWYLSGGIAAANCIAAYTPKGAASLAASYDNYAAPGNGLADGTYDCTLGVAPTWAVGTGWTFDGITQYLKTGIVPTTGAWSMFVQFNGARIVITPASGANCLVGAVNTVPGLGRFGMANARRLIGVDKGVEYEIGSGGSGNGYIPVLPSIAAGNLGIAGAKCYRNGVSEGTSLSAVGSTQTIWIGVMNVDGAPYADWFYLGNIQAIAVYNITITGAQIIALVAAMAAL